MKIVVDIDDQKYKWIVENPQAYTDELHDAIRNGTPLPEGHGRIKDIDKIEWYGCTTEFDCPYKDRECKDCGGAECSKTQVDAIPTIIEADKEE